MTGPELELKAAGAPGASVVSHDVVQARDTSIVVTWSTFMLQEPQPVMSVEDLMDLEGARRAMAEPGSPSPYEDVRRELGLA